MLKNIIKTFIKLIIEFVKFFLPWRYRIRISSQLMDDDFLVFKRSLFLKEFHIKKKSINPGKPKSIQTIISTLPNIHNEFRIEDWLWSDTYYPYYEKITSLFKPQNIFEIGALQGFSLIALLQGYDKINSIIWIDNESFLENSNQMCYENIIFYFNTFSKERILPSINYFKSHQDFSNYDCYSNKIDLVHIDGEHTYEGKLKDLNFCIKLKPKYILLDDYNYHSVNKDAINHWAKTMEYNFFVIDTFKRGLAFFDFSDNQNAYSKLKENGILIKETIKYK